MATVDGYQLSLCVPFFIIFSFLHTDFFFGLSNIHQPFIIGIEHLNTQIFFPWAMSGFSQAK